MNVACSVRARLVEEIVVEGSVAGWTLTIGSDSTPDLMESIPKSVGELESEIVEQKKINSDRLNVIPTKIQIKMK